MERDALNKMTVVKLRDQAKSMGLAVKTKMKKDEIIALLLSEKKPDSQAKQNDQEVEKEKKIKNPKNREKKQTDGKNASRKKREQSKNHKTADQEHNHRGRREIGRASCRERV